MLRKTLIYMISFSYAFIFFSVNSYSADRGEREDTVFKKAERYFYEKKFEMAELLLREELKKNPENQLAYSYLGDILLQKKRYDDALKQYKKSLDINPANGEDYFRIGQVYYYKNESGPAIQNFEKAYKINPELKFVYFHVGLTYLKLLRDKENTIKNWQIYLDLAPEDPQYEKIRKAIELLKDPNFKIPPPGSDISIEDALQLGGVDLKEAERKAAEKKAGHEKKKTKHKLEDIYRDDDL